MTSEVHPTGKVWDVVSEIAVDGSMTGKLDFRDSAKGVTGRMTFDTEDGNRFSVYVERADEAVTE